MSVTLQAAIDCLLDENIDDPKLFTLTGEPDEIIAVAKCGLTWMKETDWLPHGLDLIHASEEDPWGLIQGGTIRQLCFYGDRWSEGELVAIRFDVVRTAESTEFWIGVGTEESMREASDLVVCAARKPANFSELVLLEAVKA